MFHDMKRGHSWNRTSHFIQRLWNYRSWLGDLCSISDCMVFDGFLEMIFSNSRGNVWDFPPHHPSHPKMILNLDPKPMWHSLTTHHGQFWESFGRRVFEKKQKRHFKIHGGVLVKLIVDLICHDIPLFFHDISGHRSVTIHWLMDVFLRYFVALHLFEIVGCFVGNFVLEVTDGSLV